MLERTEPDAGVHEEVRPASSILLSFLSSRALSNVFSFSFSFLFFAERVRYPTSTRHSSSAKTRRLEISAIRSTGPSRTTSSTRSCGGFQLGMCPRRSGWGIWWRTRTWCRSWHKPVGRFGFICFKKNVSVLFPSFRSSRSATVECLALAQRLKRRNDVC